MKDKSTYFASRNLWLYPLLIKSRFSIGNKLCLDICIRCASNHELIIKKHQSHSLVFITSLSLRRCISLVHLSQKKSQWADQPTNESFSRHSKVAAQLFFPPFHCLPFSLHSRHTTFSLFSLPRERAETKIDRYFLSGKDLRTIRDNLKYDLLLELLVNFVSK